MLVYINSFAEERICLNEGEYLFGCNYPAVNHIFLLMKFTTWFIRNFEKLFNINIFRYNLYKRIKADESYKSTVKFNLESNKAMSIPKLN